MFLIIEKVLNISKKSSPSWNIRCCWDIKFWRNPHILLFCHSTASVFFKHSVSVVLKGNVSHSRRRWLSQLKETLYFFILVLLHIKVWTGKTPLDRALLAISWRNPSRFFSYPTFSISWKLFYFSSIHPLHIFLSLIHLTREALDLCLQVKRSSSPDGLEDVKRKRNNSKYSDMLWRWFF
jgi:hypothetical protein